MIGLLAPMGQRAATADCGGLSCPFTCADITGDQTVDLSDFLEIAGCFALSPDTSQACCCADMDGNSAVDLQDFLIFASLFGLGSDDVPPNCAGGPPVTGDLTAHRPQNGASYSPFAKRAVADAEEESSTLGPGIRINAPGDVDPAGEDDLIELLVTIEPGETEVALRRSTGGLRVWTARDKSPGTELAFNDDKTGTLPFGAGQPQLTLWVEWASSVHGTGELTLEPISAAIPLDTLLFHTFMGLTLALGGEDQVPSDPPDPNHGTFVVAADLYARGYDVRMFDEDEVSANGSGPVYNEAVTAVQHRGVNEVAIFGYSHGGGSTYDLADRLDVNRAGIGVFEIACTSYVDSVSNNSDVDLGQELRRPPSTGYHVNHYQHGSFFEDLGLDGGPVPDSNPPPTGLDVETTVWGAGSTHFEVDDFVEVRSLMIDSLTTLVER